MPSANPPPSIATDPTALMDPIAGAAHTPETLARFLDWVLRHRSWSYALVALVMIAGFNGQWRPGRDSAAYRGIARNLIRLHRYEYRPKIAEAQAYADKQDTMYRGLTWALAALDWAVGEAAWVPLLLMYAVALATLLLVDRLARLHGPPWAAVAVVLLLGVSRLFLEHANEILTDLPFLLGVVMALWGFERARRDARLTVGAVAWMVGGLILAALMRPTFWFVAVAWAGACAWGILTAMRRRGPYRPYAVAVGALLFAVAVALASNPRAKETGSYEARVTKQISDKEKFAKTLKPKLKKALVEHIPLAFFGVTVKSEAPVLRALAVA